MAHAFDRLTNRDPAQATHEEKTRRLTDTNDRIRDHLLEMRPGELRWLWFDEQNGSLCDHFGCSGGPTPYAAKLELVSVVRHHAELPDGMHITAWPLLGVRRGELWAPLSGDQVNQIDKTTLDASGVTIDLVSDRAWGSLVAAPSTAMARSCSSAGAGTRPRTRSIAGVRRCATDI